MIFTKNTIIGLLFAAADAVFDLGRPKAKNIGFVMICGVVWGAQNAPTNDKNRQENDVEKRCVLGAVF